MTMKYQILIFDDEADARDKTYRALLEDEFDLQYVRTEDQFKDFPLEMIHAVLIHVNLGMAMSLTEAVDHVKCRKPIALVSNIWEEEKTHREVIRVLKNIRAYNIIHVIALSAVNNSQYRAATRVALHLALNRAYQRSSFNPAPNETLNILHLSDPQFGDEHDSETFLVEKKVGNLLDTKKIKAHFLCITGDISYSGQPCEYAMAKEWIEQLTQEIWRDVEAKDRILLVPGNHDADFSIFSANNYKYDFKSKKFIKKPADHEHDRYKFHAFREFAYELTKCMQWQDIDHMCWIDDRFMHLGIRFYLLNSVAGINIGSEQSSAIPEKALAEITTKKMRSSEDDLYNIAFSHHGPPSSDSKEISYENWPKVRQFLQTANIRLLMHGHGHKRAANHLDAYDETRKVIRVMAPATHLIKNKLADDARRGFNLVQLIRADGRVTKLIVAAYEMRGGELQEVWPKPLDFSVIK